MKITVNQLKRIIAEEVKKTLNEGMDPNVVNTFERMDELAPGDEITINGSTKVVIGFDRELLKLYFWTPPKRIRQSIDARLALEEEPGDTPEYEVVFVKHGDAPSRPRNPPMKKRMPHYD